MWLARRRRSISPSTGRRDGEGEGEQHVDTALPLAINYVQRQSEGSIPGADTARATFFHVLRGRTLGEGGENEQHVVAEVGAVGVIPGGYVHEVGFIRMR